jgi:hypothetical protein
MCLVSLLFCPAANAEELRDIRGPVAIPGEWTWLWILLAVLVVGSAAAFLLPRIKAKASTIVEPPRKSPWERALGSLTALEGAQRTTTQEIKEFYFQMSVIVRTYIEERFEIRAPEMTTEEFLEKTSASSALSAQHKQFLQDFLNASDLVKFAKLEPAPSDMAQALGLARTFVLETVPRNEETVHGV